MLAFVSGGATALTGVRRAQLRHHLSADLDAGLKFEARLGSYRSSLTVVRLAAVVGAISTATLLATDLGEIRWWSITAAGIASALLITIAEALPRSWAAKQPEKYMRRFALPLVTLNALARPITRLIPLSSEAAFSQSSSTPAETIGPLEEARLLKELVSAQEETGELHEDERKMIRAILALGQSTVKEIMVPRTDFTAVSTEATLSEVVQLLVASGRSRIPLYEGTIDSIVGVIYAKDVLSSVESDAESFEARLIAREPYFIPETKKVRELLSEFQNKAVHFALVVDEHGGVEGLVSLNDVLEEIVGEIEEEFETPEEDIRLVSDREAILDGAVNIDEVNEALDIALEGNGFETIAGYVLHHMGRIPKTGEQLETDGILIEVLSTIGRRVKKVRLKKQPDQTKEAQAAS